MKLKNTLMIIFCVVFFSIKLKAMDSAPKKQESIEEIEKRIANAQALAQQLRAKINQLGPNLSHQQKQQALPALISMQQQVQNMLESFHQDDSKK